MQIVLIVLQRLEVAVLRAAAVALIVEIVVHLFAVVQIGLQILEIVVDHFAVLAQSLVIVADHLADLAQNLVIVADHFADLAQNLVIVADHSVDHSAFLNHQIVDSVVVFVVVLLFSQLTLCFVVLVEDLG